MARWPRFRYDDRVGQYVNAQGRFVSHRAVRGALDDAIRVAGNRMSQASESLRRGTMSLASWEDVMFREIKNVHMYSAAAAKGGWHKMSFEDYGRIGPEIRAQYGYVDRFARQIEAGLPLDGRFIQRTRLYGESGRSTYHIIEARDRAARGYTVEKSVLGPADHCGDCIGEAGRGFVPIGTLIPIGARQCLGWCKCTIEYSKKDPGAPPTPGSGIGSVDRSPDVSGPLASARAPGPISMEEIQEMRAHLVVLENQRDAAKAAAGANWGKDRPYLKLRNQATQLRNKIKAAEESLGGIGPILPPPPPVVADINLGLMDSPEYRALLRRYNDAGIRPGDKPPWATEAIGDVTLHEFYKLRGFNTLPQVVSKIEDLADDGIEMWRGVSSTFDLDAGEMARRYMAGDHYAGFGVYGNGTYASTKYSAAPMAFSSSRGVVMHISLSKRAKIIDYNDLAQLQDAEFKKLEKLLNDRSHALLAKEAERVGGDIMKARGLHVLHEEDEVYQLLRLHRDMLQDRGRFAISQGYDAIRVHVDSAEDYYVIFNRGMVRIEGAVLDRRTNKLRGIIETRTPEQIAIDDALEEADALFRRKVDDKIMPAKDADELFKVSKQPTPPQAELDKLLSQGATIQTDFDISLLRTTDAISPSIKLDDVKRIIRNVDVGEIPVVYRRLDGEHIIISGHDRVVASMARRQGKMRVRIIKEPLPEPIIVPPPPPPPSLLPLQREYLELIAKRDAAKAAAGDAWGKDKTYLTLRNKATQLRKKLEAQSIPLPTAGDLVPVPPKPVLPRAALPSASRVPGKSYFKADDKFISEMETYLRAKATVGRLEIDELEAEISRFTRIREENLRKIGAAERRRLNNIINKNAGIYNKTQAQIDEMNAARLALRGLSDAEDTALKQLLVRRQELFSQTVRDIRDEMKALQATIDANGGIAPPGTLNKMKELRDELKLFSDTWTYDSKMRKMMRESILIHDRSEVMSGKIKRNFRQTMKANMDQAVEDFNRMLPASVKNKLGTITIRRGGKRAHYSNRGREVVMGDSDIGTAIHEFGHYIEYDNADIQRAAFQFLEDRTAGEVSTKLKFLHPSSGYKDDEITKADEFFDSYVGKQYYWGGARNASEVISMGFEAMWRDPMKFLHQDPDHFALIWSIMTGAL